MKLKDTKCAGNESKLAELLLDPEGTPAKVRAHVEECESCGEELKGLKATMSLLDEWESPEPNPFFMSRLEARMREERQAEPAGWLKRRMAVLHAGIAYGPRIHMRPLAVMALTVALLLGGGAYLDLANWNQVPLSAKQTAVVHDLQTMENNAQLLDQLEALSITGNPDDRGN